MNARSVMPLSAGRLIAYASPTVALQAMMVPLLLYLPPAYYSEMVGLSLATVGLAFLVGRAFEAVSDPLIGAISDRTVSRFGRRRLWMVIGTPAAIFSAAYLLTPAHGASGAYLLVWLVAFYVGWTLVFIPHQTWGSELAGDYHERTRIAGFRETGAFVGYLLAALVPLIYWKLVRGIEAPSFLQIVQAIGVFFAVMLPLATVFCLLLVPPVARAAGESTPSWKDLYAILGRNRPFLRLATAYLIDRISMGTYFAAQPLLVGLALNLQADVLWVALATGVASAALAPLWVPIGRRVGKHRAYCLANGVTMLGYAMLFYAVPGGLAYVLVCQTVLGLGNGGTMIMPPAMTADTVDYDELKSGVAQMGGHMAFLSFVFKGGMACGPFIGLGFISLFGYEGGAATLGPSGTLGIRLCASWLPVLLLVPPILLMWQFPIGARRQRAIRRRLERRQTRLKPQALEIETDVAPLVVKNS
jgi:Na+/melibiose symporter-like transporter